MGLPLGRVLTATLSAVGLTVAAAPWAVAVVPAPAGSATPPAVTVLDAVGGPRLGSPGIVAGPALGVPAPPAVRVQSYMLADTGTGTVLAAKNAHQRLPPASTQKILTSLTLLPRLNPARVYRATPADVRVEGSRVGLAPGATYTVNDLFRGLLMVSGNDAASALANAAGGFTRTVAAMNAVAHELNALDTTVVNPSGLDAPGQLSSAYDLALISRAALSRPDFRAHVATRRASFPGKMPAAGKGRARYEIGNLNRLLGRYPGAIGVKTGFTTQARATFVGAATRGGRTLLVTIMRAGPRSWLDASALLDWGFRYAGQLPPVGRLVGPGPLPVAARASSTAGLRPLPGPGPISAQAPLSSSAVSGEGRRPLAAGAAAAVAAGGAGGALAAVAVLRLRMRLRRRRADVR